MRSNYRSERATAMRAITAVAIKRTITILEQRVAESRRFYPWESLADSWLDDIAMLQARLKDLQSK